MSIRPQLEAALYRYAQGYDSNDMELLASVFADDVSMTGMGETVVGRDAIRARSAGMRDQLRADGGRPRHIVSNVIVESESDTEARSRAYFMFSVAKPGAVTVVATGCYHDRWVIDGMSWRIVERTVESDTAA
jgi:hypothetical protein